MSECVCVSSSTFSVFDSNLYSENAAFFAQSVVSDEKRLGHRDECTHHTQQQRTSHTRSLSLCLDHSHMGDAHGERWIVHNKLHSDSRSSLAVYSHINYAYICCLTFFCLNRTGTNRKLSKDTCVKACTHAIPSCAYLLTLMLSSIGAFVAVAMSAKTHTCIYFSLLTFLS